MESFRRKELLLIDGGMCRWHLRRNGQITIREIFATKKGAGSHLLERLRYTIGASSIFAKCPSDLESNNQPSEFGVRPVHLLGGSPQKQLALAKILNVKSVDINYHQKQAVQRCQYYTNTPRSYAKNRHWPTLRESDGGWSDDAYIEAFRRSLHNIKQAWISALADSSESCYSNPYQQPRLIE